MPRNASQHMVLRMTVEPENARHFTAIEDADGLAACELRGFDFETVIVGGRIRLFKQNGGYYLSMGFEPTTSPSLSGDKS